MPPSDRHARTVHLADVESVEARLELHELVRSLPMTHFYEYKIVGNLRSRLRPLGRHRLVQKSKAAAMNIILQSDRSQDCRVQ